MLNVIQKSCALCHLPNCEVKRLACSHIFCEECLRRHLVEGGYDRVGYFPCPVCKLGISVPLGGLHNLTALQAPPKPPRQHAVSFDKPQPVPIPFRPREVVQEPQLSNPTSISCTDENQIVISDLKNSCIFIYNLEGKLISCFSIKEKIFSCLFTNFGSIFISNAESHVPLILEYSLNGKRLLSRPMMNKMEATHGICMLNAPRQIVVSSVETSSLYVIGDSGKLVHRFNGKALLGHPYYITTTPSNDIIVSDRLNHCLKVISRDGKLKSTISSVGTSEQSLYEPMGVAVERCNVLVADSGNRSVKSFKVTSGKFNCILFQTRSPERPISVALTHDQVNVVVLLVGGAQPRFVVRNYEDLQKAPPIACV